MSTLDKLLAPYRAAVGAQPTTTASLQQDPLYSLLFPTIQQRANDAASTPNIPGSEGDWSELMVEQPGGLSTGLHLHGASGSLPLGQIAKWAEAKGFDISQLLGYQGTNKQNIGTHSPNSWHYRVNPNTGKGEAFDANYYGGGRWDSEEDALSWLLRKLENRYG